jgi:hypothetical protein
MMMLASSDDDELLVPAGVEQKLKPKQSLPSFS